MKGSGSDARTCRIAPVPFCHSFRLSAGSQFHSLIDILVLLFPAVAVSIENANEPHWERQAVEPTAWLPHKKADAVCVFLCRVCGAFQSAVRRSCPNLFEMGVDEGKVRGLHAVRTGLSYDGAVGWSRIKQGKTLMNCMKCGACVDSCKKDAAVSAPEGDEGGARERSGLVSCSCMVRGRGSLPCSAAAFWLTRWRPSCIGCRGSEEGLDAGTDSECSGLCWGLRSALVVAACVPFVLMGVFTNAVAFMRVCMWMRRIPAGAGRRGRLPRNGYQVVVLGPVYPHALQQVESFRRDCVQAAGGAAGSSGQ